MRCSWFYYNLLSFCSTKSVERALKASQRQQGSDPELTEEHLESLLAFPGNERMFFYVGTRQPSLCLLPLAFTCPRLPLMREWAIEGKPSFLEKCDESLLWGGAFSSVCAVLVWLCKGESWGYADGLNCSWRKLEVFPCPSVFCLNSLTFAYPSI